MKIEVGKIYKNNNGEIIKINSLEPVDDYPFLGDDGFYYTKTGNFYLETNCDLDLIEEVTTGENMNDHERKIADLENRIAELESRLTPCNGAVAEPKKWSPVGGHWWIRFIGDVVCNGDSTPYSKEFGTERKTCEQAKLAAVEMRKFNRLLALRDELCGDDTVHWVTNENYLIYYDYEDSKYAYCSNCIMETISAVYFPTAHSVQRACDMLNSGEVEL